MKYERFLEIKATVNKYKYDSIDKRNYLGNKEVYQSRYDSKNEIDMTHFRWLIEDLNYEGNGIYTQEQGIKNICCLIHFNIFTEEQWKELLPYIFFEDFNKDYDELEKIVLPLFGKLYKWHRNISLEFWQGIFSFGSHQRTKGKTLEECINFPENGELYCNTLLEIYPILKEFINKYPYAQSTLMQRLS